MKKISILLCFILFLGVLSANAQTKNIQLTFSPDDYSVEFDASGLALIKAKKAGHALHDEDRLSPALPYKRISVLIPANTTFKSFSLFTSANSSFKSGITLMSNPGVYLPGQAPLKNEVLYRPGSYPEKTAGFLSELTMDGYRFVSFDVCPFVYESASKSLRFISEVQITLELTPQAAPANPRGDVMRNAVKAMVCNPEELDVLYPVNKLRSAVTANTTEYLIVTTDELKASFIPLRNWKITKGVPAKIITTSEIYSKYQGATEREKIKRCLQDYYNNHGLKYALLGGDGNQIPVIKCQMVIINSGKTIDEEIPTDWYYACFEKNFDWDGNKNDTIGEVKDNIDLTPEISVSRAPAANVANADIFVSKTIAYEQKPALQNWAKKLLFTGGPINYRPQYRPDMQDTYNHYEWWYTTRIKDNWLGGVCKSIIGFQSSESSSVIYELNKDEYQFLYNHSHGNNEMWSVNGGPAEILTGKQAGELTNKNPLIISTQACGDNYYTLPRNIGRKFMDNPYGGAVIYWAGSATTFSCSLPYDFIEHMLFSPAPNPADAVLTAKKNSIQYADGEYSRWNVFVFNLLGDPELPVYNENPKQFTTASISWNGSTLAVNTGGIDSCTIAVSSRSDHGASYYNVVKPNSQTTYSFTNAPEENYAVCITKPNYIPKVFYSGSEDPETDIRIKLPFIKPFGTYKFISVATDKCMAENSGNLSTEPFSKLSGQEWLITQTGDYSNNYNNGYFKISLSDNKTLTASNNALTLSSSNGSDSQLWEIALLKSGYYSIRSKATGYYLATTGSGLRLEESPYGGVYSNTQKWKVSHTQLFLVGNATPAAWDLNKVISMNSMEDDVFTWTGYLTTGEFKFNPLKSSWNQALNSDGYATKLGENIYRIGYNSENDTKFNIQKAGYYSISINLKEFDIYGGRMQLAESPDLHYIVGSATPRAWDNINPEPLVYKGEKGKYTWTGYLKQGEVKFISKLNTWSTGIWASFANDQLIPGYLHTIVPGTNLTDNKFIVTVADNYTIDIDTESKTMKVKRLSGNAPLYLVGAATAAGWDNTKAIAMTQESEGVYTWTGTLKADQFKFITQLGTWNSIVPDRAAHETVINEYKHVISNYYRGDYRFAIYNAGDYKITVDLNQHSMIVKKLSGNEPVYLIGAATTAGWDNTKPIAMTRESEGIYTWTGALKADHFKFITQPGTWNSIVPDKAANEQVVTGTNQVVSNNYRGDYRFIMPLAGNYTITLNIRDHTMVVSNPVLKSATGLDAPESEENLFSVATHPGFIEVMMNSDAKTDVSRLFDIHGKLIDMKENKTGSFYLGNNLSAGVYVITIHCNGQDYSRKVVVK